MTGFIDTRLPFAPSLLPEGIAFPISITGIGALSSLGQDVESHFQAISKGCTGIRPLGELLGEESAYGQLPGAWISPRSLLNHRKWSPASMAALHVAKEAIKMAGWNAADLEEAALILGTSRGNAAGWLGPWPGRRPFKLMAASNTIHSEPATAISIELGILGPNHVLASGCSAGLDALGLGKLLIDSGQVQRALVVAVDLPLVPILLKNYSDSGLLGTRAKLNPFSPDTDGFLPGEGAAAIALSAAGEGKVRFEHFANNSDGADPVGIPQNGGRTHLLLENAIGITGQPTAIFPHATGTLAQARAEQTILGKSLSGHRTSIHLLKPFIGHTIGASGLLESAILIRFLQDSSLPPNLAGTAAFGTFTAPDRVTPVTGPVFKLAHGMGGHNALAVFHNLS